MNKLRKINYCSIQERIFLSLLFLFFPSCAYAYGPFIFVATLGIPCAIVTIFASIAIARNVKVKRLKAIAAVLFVIALISGMAEPSDLGAYTFLKVLCFGVALLGSIVFLVSSLFRDDKEEENESV